MLNLIARELHKPFAPRLNPVFDDGAKALYRDTLRSLFELINHQPRSGNCVVGDSFSHAEAHLLTVTR